MNPLIRLLRPHDWIKNIFLFAPLFFTPVLFHIPQITTVLFGVILFSMNASGIYILNDLNDAQADLLHPKKRSRPIASGDIKKSTAIALFLILSMVSLFFSYFLQPQFCLILSIYFILNIAYCFWLKHIAIIDIYCISAGFVLRVLAGAVLISVTPSAWILLCTGFLALFLALAKRRDDLVHGIDENHRESMRGYNIVFIDTCIAIVLGALLIAYTIYTTISTAINTEHFYWTVPVVLLGILRYLQITLVEERSGSPTMLLYRDTFLLGTVIVWIIVSAVLMY